jgi:hypothetical protein
VGRRYISLAKMKKRLFLMLENRWQVEEDTVDKWTEIVQRIVLANDLTLVTLF